MEAYPRHHHGRTHKGRYMVNIHSSSSGKFRGQVPYLFHRTTRYCNTASGKLITANKRETVHRHNFSAVWEHRQNIAAVSRYAAETMSPFRVATETLPTFSIAAETIPTSKVSVKNSPATVTRRRSAEDLTCRELEFLGWRPVLVLFCLALFNVVHLPLVSSFSICFSFFFGSFSLSFSGCLIIFSFGMPFGRTLVFSVV